MGNKPSLSEGFLPNPDMDKIDECGDYVIDENSKLSYGVCGVQGWRANMEDSHLAHYDPSKRVAIFGVFDGHGGPAVSATVSKYFVKFLQSCDEYKENNFPKALHSTFMNLDHFLSTQAGRDEIVRLGDAIEIEQIDREEEQRVKNRGKRKHSSTEDKHILKFDPIQIYDYLVCLPNEYIENGRMLAAAYGGLNDDTEETVKTPTTTPRKGITKSLPSTPASRKRDRLEKRRDALHPVEVKSPGRLLVLSPAEEEDVDNNKTITILDNNKTITIPVEPLISKILQAPIEVFQEEGEESMINIIESGGPESLRELKISSENLVNVVDNEEAASLIDLVDEELDPTLNVDPEVFARGSPPDFLGHVTVRKLAKGRVLWELDRDFVREALGVKTHIPDPDIQGSTASVVLIHYDETPKIYCANAGDSRTILGRLYEESSESSQQPKQKRKRGQARACRRVPNEVISIPLSSDHKPNQKEERLRIQTAGGFITKCAGLYRVNGDLNLSRSLGDFRHKTNEDLYAEDQSITAMPDVRTRTLCKNDSYLILGCDGVWDMLSNEECALLVHEGFKKTQRKIKTIKNKMAKGSPTGSPPTTSPLSSTSDVTFALDLNIEPKSADSLALQEVAAQVCFKAIAPVKEVLSGNCNGYGCDNVTALIVKLPTNLIDCNMMSLAELEDAKRQKGDKMLIDSILKPGLVLAHNLHPDPEHRETCRKEFLAKKAENTKAKQDTEEPVTVNTPVETTQENNSFKRSTRKRVKNKKTSK